MSGAKGFCRMKEHHGQRHGGVKQPLSEIKVKKWMEAVIDLGSSHLSYSPLQLTGASVSSVGPCGTKLMSHPGWSGSSHA